VRPWLGKTEHAENEKKVIATPEKIFSVRVFSNDANLFMAQGSKYLN
jgi:hypothetical protein